MHDIIERPKVIDVDTAKSVGADKVVIVQCIDEFLTNNDCYQVMPQAHNPYGDGKACIRIFENIKDLLDVS